MGGSDGSSVDGVCALWSIPTTFALTEGPDPYQERNKSPWGHSGRIDKDQETTQARGESEYVGH